MTWEMKPLGELLTTSIGGVWGSAPGEDQEDVWVARVTELRAHGQLDLRTAARRSISGRQLLSRRLQRGDLLLEKSGGGPKTPVGRVGLVTRVTEPTVCANFMQLMRPNQDRVAPRYLHLYLNHFHDRDGTVALQKATTNIRNLKVQDYLAAPIPLPALPAQHRIVELVEEHLSHLDAADAALLAVKERSTVLTEAALAQALAGHARMMPLRQVLAAPLTNGRSVPTSERGAPVLRLTALRADRVDLRERKIGAWSLDEARPFFVKRGDFLVSRGNGSKHLVGRGSLLAEEPDEVAFPDTAIRVRPDTAALDPRFLALVWNSIPVRQQIEQQARTTAGIYKVNQKLLGDVRIPVPESGVQQEILRSVSSVQEQSLRLATATRATQARSVALRRAVLAAAFSGRLTGSSSDTEVIEEAAAGLAPHGSGELP